MPTLSSRRYMRAKVGATEKVVGGLILLLLAGIVAAFVVQSATNKDHLFEVDEALLKQQRDAYQQRKDRHP